MILWVSFTAGAPLKDKRRSHNAQIVSGPFIVTISVMDRQASSAVHEGETPDHGHHRNLRDDRVGDRRLDRRRF
jgi:hypothetical protein